MWKLWNSSKQFRASKLFHIIVYRFTYNSLFCRFHVELCIFLLSLVVLPTRAVFFLILNWFFLGNEDVFQSMYASLVKNFMYILLSWVLLCQTLLKKNHNLCWILYNWSFEICETWHNFLARLQRNSGLWIDDVHLSVRLSVCSSVHTVYNGFLFILFSN